MLAQAENLTLWSRKPGRDPYAGLFCLALTGTCLPATTFLAKRSEMAGLLSRARGPDREVRVEKPGLPSAGLLFLVLPALHRFPLPIWDQIESEGETPTMRFLTYLGLLSATLLWLGILWAFAQDPRDDLAVFAA